MTDAAEDVAFMATLSTIGSSIFSVISSIVAAGMQAVSEVVNAITSLISTFISNPWLLLIIPILILSLMWGPYHHVGFQVGQIVYTDVMQPIARDVLVPVLNTLAPSYRAFAGWYNFILKVPMKLLLDAVLLLLRCKHLPTFIRTVVKNVVPIARAFAIIVRAVLHEALVGKTIPIIEPQLAAGLFLNATANVIDGATDVVGCACSLISYYLDFVTLLLRDDNIECMLSNLLGFVGELITQLSRSVRGLVTLVIAIARWLSCVVFTCAGPNTLPTPNVRSILPVMNILFDRFGAFSCCATDAFDDITNAMLDSAIDIANEVDLTLYGNMSIPGFIRFARPLKALVPVLVENLRIGYDITLGTLDGTFDYSDVNFNRSWESTAFMCHSMTDAFKSYGTFDSHNNKSKINIFLRHAAPAISLVGTTGVLSFLVGAATSSATGVGAIAAGVSSAASAISTVWGASSPVLGVLFQYGPNFFNHTCLAAVTLAHGTIDMAVSVRSFNDYVEGRHLDCFLHEMRKLSEEMGQDVTNIWSLIPAWRSCRITPTVYDDEGYPTLKGFPQIKCDDSFFHDEVGDWISFPFKLASASLDYAISLSETFNISSGVGPMFNSARKVSTGCIFDEITQGIRSYGYYQSAIYDQIPNSIFDLRLVTKDAEEFSTEVFKYVLPRLAKVFGTDYTNRSISIVNTITRYIRMILDVVPFSDELIDQPLVHDLDYLNGTFRHVGIFDIWPQLSITIPAGPVAIPIPLCDTRTFPALVADTGVLITELIRFLLDLVHTSNKQWDFDYAIIERFLRAEVNFTNRLAYAVVRPLCLIRNVTSKSESFTPPNCTGYVNVDAIEYELCPLNLIPCPEQTFQYVLRVLVRIINIVPRLAFYPKEFVSELLDPALCELETATYMLTQELEEWGNLLDMHLPYWGTDLEVDVPNVLGGLLYTAAKILVVANKLLIETFELFMQREFKAMPGCTTDFPSYNTSIGDCVKCTDTAVDAWRCPPGTQCCAISGQCARACFDGNGLVTSVNDAASAWAFFTDKLTKPLGLLDPVVSGAFYDISLVPAIMFRTLFRFLFAATTAPRGRFSDILPEVTCILDQLAVMLAGTQTAMVAIVGRFVAMIIELAGNEAGADTMRTRVTRFTSAIRNLIATFVAIISETLGAVLRVVGMIFDISTVKSFKEWISEATSGLCRVFDALGRLPAAMKEFLLALDLPDSGFTCEIALMGSALINVVTTLLQEMINLVGKITQSEYLGQGFNIQRLVEAIRDVVIEIGNVLAFMLFFVFDLFLPNPSDARDTIHTICDLLGLLVSSIINMPLSLIEAFFNLWRLLVSALPFGLDEYLAFLCGPVVEAFDVLVPPLNALAIVLTALAEILDLMFEGAGIIMRVFVWVIRQITAPGSAVAELVSATFEIFTSFVSLIFGIFTGDFDLGPLLTAIGRFFRAVKTFLFTFIVDLVDRIFFGGFRLLNCLLHLFKCIFSPSKYLRFPKDSILESRPMFSGIGIYAYAFPENDSCHQTYREIAKLAYDFYQLEQRDPEDDEIKLGLFMRIRGVYCVWRFEKYTQLNDTAEEEARAEARARRSPVSDIQVRDMLIATTPDAICERTGDGDYGLGLFGDPVCQIDTMTRVVYGIKDVVSDMVEAAKDTDIARDLRREYSRQQREVTPLHQMITARTAMSLSDLFTQMAGTLSEQSHQMAVKTYALASGITETEAAETLRHVARVGESFKRYATDVYSRIDEDALTEYLTRGNLISPEAYADLRARAFYDENTEFELDDCDHIIRSAFGLIEVYEGEVCPVTCPACLDMNSTSRFNLRRLCPIMDCPDVIAAYPMLQGLCTHLCGTAAESELFSEICIRKITKYNNTLHEIWIPHKDSTIRNVIYQRYLTVNPGDYTTVFGAAEIKAVFVIEKSTSGDLCTNIARYGHPTEAYCIKQCCANPRKCTNSSRDVESLQYVVNQLDIDLEDKGEEDWKPEYHPGYATLIDEVCKQFCGNWDMSCEFPPDTIQCGTSALETATCYTACDLPYTTSLRPVKPSEVPDSCLPRVVGCSNETINRNCVCPPTWGEGLLEVDDYCYCTYEQPLVPPDLTIQDGTRVLFGCPSTFKKPDNHWLTGLDYVAVSKTMKPVRERDPFVDILHITFKNEGEVYTWGCRLPATDACFGRKWSNPLVTPIGVQPPLKNLPANDAFTPSLNSTICENTTEVVVATANYTNYLCDVQQKVCTSYSGSASTQFMEYYAKPRPIPVADLLQRYPARWSYYADMRICDKNETCIDSGYTGYCNYSFSGGGACNISATYTNPLPVDTCIPEQHCEQGEWCPYKDEFGESCCTVWGPMLFDREVYMTFDYPNHREDTIEEKGYITLAVDYTYERCEAVFCTNESFVPNNATGQCLYNNTEFIRAEYWGFGYSVPWYNLHYNRSCRVPENNCFAQTVGCLNITQYMPFIVLCTKVLLCPFAPAYTGCEHSLEECLWCYEDNTKLNSCNTMGWCFEREICDVVFGVNITALPPNPTIWDAAQNVTLCEQEYFTKDDAGYPTETDEICYEQQATAVANVSIQNAICHQEIEIAADTVMTKEVQNATIGTGLFDNEAVLPPPRTQIFETTHVDCIRSGSYPSVFNPLTPVYECTWTISYPNRLIFNIPNLLSVLLPVSGISRFPLEFIGNETSCQIPLVHKDGLCEYLCDAGYPNRIDCVELFAGAGLNCDYYRSISGTIYAVAAARRWFCTEIVPPLHNVTLGHFPIAGAGSVTYPSLVKTIIPEVEARACLAGEQYACVMVAPTNYYEPHTEDECKLIKAYLTANSNSFLDDLRRGITAAYAQSAYRIAYTDARVPKNLGWGVDVEWAEGRTTFPEEATTLEDVLRLARRGTHAEAVLGLDILDEIRELRQAVGAVGEQQWLTLIANTYTVSDTNTRVDDALAVGRAVYRAEVAEMRAMGEVTCKDRTRDCPDRDCEVPKRGPAQCWRHNITGFDVPCTRRTLICTIAMTDACETWYYPYQYVPVDPTAEYEAYGEELVEANDTFPLRAQAYTIWSAFTDMAEQAAERRRVTGHVLTFGLWQEAAAALERSVEAATCAALPGSRACARLGRALAAHRGEPVHGARLVMPQRHGARPRTVYEATRISWEANAWMPPLNSTDRSCYLFCGYDWLDLARRSCLQQAEGPNGTLTRILRELQEGMRDICYAADLGNGTEQILDLLDVLPNISRLHITRGAAPGTGNLTLVVTPPTQQWGGNNTLVLRLKILASKIATCLIGRPISPSLAGEEIGLTVTAKFLGFNSTDEFLNKTITWMINFNLDADLDDVGLFYWMTLLAPIVGAPDCAALNGTYKIPYTNIPFWWPLWVTTPSPWLPTWLGDSMLNASRCVAELDWVVPEELIVDKGECYQDQDICVPLAGPPDACPCSPIFENCGERFGFQTPLDTLYFFINWVYPGAPENRWIRTLARVTMTKPWLDEYAHVTEREDFDVYLFCFWFAGIPAAVWLIVLVPIIFLLGLLLLRVGLALLNFCLVVSWTLLLLFLFIPMEYEIRDMWY